MSAYSGIRFPRYPFVIATVLAVSAAVVSIDIADDRYDVAPRFERLDHAASGAALNAQSDAASQKLLRFVEGIDPQPRAMTDMEIGIEIHDPFGVLLVDEPGRLPGTIDEVLDMIGLPDTHSTNLPDQTVYLVHEAGQISLAEAPNLVRRPRAVILRRDPLARQAVFIAPSMRQTGTLEVMGWDASKQVFNFYERGLATNGTSVWHWKGDSSSAWRAQTRSGACFRCHRNGEVNMKELRLPWQNWHSQSSTIKPESIPADSPLRTNPIFAITEENRFLRGGDELEKIVNQWITRTNATKIVRYRAGQFGAEQLLEPFFRTTTMAMITSTDQSQSVGSEPVGLPVSFFIDQRGLLDVGELFCSNMLTLAGQIRLPRSKYRSYLADFGFRLEQPGGYDLDPGDTHFAFAASEVPRVDFDMISQLVATATVSRRMAANLLLVDFPNPVYSPIRQSLFDALITWTLDAPRHMSLDDGLVSFFGNVARDPAKSPELRDAAQAFLDRWSLPEGDWKNNACNLVDSYLGRIAGRFAAGDAGDYFELLASRYASLRASDHASLIESHLLLPRTAAFSGLVMRADGTVETGTLKSN